MHLHRELKTKKDRRCISYSHRSDCFSTFSYSSVVIVSSRQKET